MKYYDEKETRDNARREAEQFSALRSVLTSAKANAPAYSERLRTADIERLIGRAELATLPVLRKSALGEMQAEMKPLGGLATREIAGFANIFQSPGPIYEAVTDEGRSKRVERFLHAAGVKAGDIVHNCFSYHFTPAGLMLDAAARKLGAPVFPAGVGQTELQARAAHDLGANVYVGTPDYLKTICEKADELNLSLAFTIACVTGGALFPTLREFYEARGIAVYECYATAELGLVAYQTPAKEGMVIDEDVILEIVRPGTGDPVELGEVGEILVTLLDEDYPLVRFATGDMTKILAGDSPCGRTNQRIAGWMGRADQATKVKGMFVRPEQIAHFVRTNPEIARAKAVVTRKGEADHLRVLCEAEAGDAGALVGSLRDTIKLGAEVEIVPIGSLPNDGLVIEDKRNYE